MTDQEQQRAAFEREAMPHMQALYGKAYRLIGNSHDAEELVQETYLRAYRTFSNFKPGTNSKAWLFKILYSVFVNRYRKQQREPYKVSMDDIEERFGQTLADPGYDPEKEIIGNPHFEWREPEVKEALGQLPEEFRAAVLLVDVEGMTYEEASEALDCPIGTLRSRLYRARKGLYTALHEYAAAHGFLRRINDEQ